MLESINSNDISYLEKWAEQGVLMLNTSLSVEAHKAGSHANQGWEQFTGKFYTICCYCLIIICFVFIRCDYKVFK